jgi:hypothetical protein
MRHWVNLHTIVKFEKEKYNIGLQYSLNKSLIFEIWYSLNNIIYKNTYIYMTLIISSFMKEYQDKHVSNA